MSEPGWKSALRGSLEALTEQAFEKDPCLTEAGMEVVLPHIEAAYQRGLMAGRSQQGYAARRKSKESPCTADAAGPTPASNTADEP